MQLIFVSPLTNVIFYRNSIEGNRIVSLIFEKIKKADSETRQAFAGLQNSRLIRHKDNNSVSFDTNHSGVIKMFKKFTELPENNTNVSVFKGFRTGAERLLEVKFRELLGEAIFVELVQLTRGGTG